MKRFSIILGSIVVFVSAILLLVIAFASGAEKEDDIDKQMAKVRDAKRKKAAERKMYENAQIVEPEEETKIEDHGT